MNTLIVKQRLSNGTTKTWKLRSSQPVSTFGSSRVANLISISPSSKGIQGTFEFRDGKWWYIDMNVDMVAVNDSCETCIDKEKSMEVSGSTLELVPLQRESDLYQRLEKNPHNRDGVKKPYQLFLVKHGEKVVETRVLRMGENFVPTNSTTKKVIPAKDTETWVQYTLDQYIVRQKTVWLYGDEDMTRITADQLLDKESKKGVSILLAAGFLMLGFVVFKPQKEEQSMAVAIPVQAEKVLVKVDKIKHKKMDEQKVVQHQPPTPNAGTPKPDQAKPGPAGGGRIANMLKAVADPRLSRLIGKVSAQAAKSANVVVSNGVKAGAGASGRALSAIGNVDRSGHDYGTDSSAQGVMISTAGRGGGKNTAGIGGLGAGNTGNAGVGLIEDESEVVGGLDREVIAQYIKSQLGQILYCYERQLSANPDLFGKVAVKFTIGGSGAVETQAIGDTTLRNATVEGCILNKVARWKFPAPAGGTKVLVTYPFLFKSTN